MVIYRSLGPPVGCALCSLLPLQTPLVPSPSSSSLKLLTLESLQHLLHHRKPAHSLHREVFRGIAHVLILTPRKSAEGCSSQETNRTAKTPQPAPEGSSLELRLPSHSSWCRHAGFLPFSPSRWCPWTRGAQASFPLCLACIFTICSTTRKKESAHTWSTPLLDSVKRRKKGVMYPPVRSATQLGEQGFFCQLPFVSITHDHLLPSPTGLTRGSLFFV